MKGLRYFILIFLLAAIAGCATTGPIPDFKNGKTTTEEVRTLLGEPDEKSAGSDGDIWTYRFARGAGDVRTLLDIKITFRDNVLKEYVILVSKGSYEKTLQGEPGKEPPRRSFPPRRPFGPRRPFMPR